MSVSGSGEEHYRNWTWICSFSPDPHDGILACVTLCVDVRVQASLSVDSA